MFYLGCLCVRAGYCICFVFDILYFPFLKFIRSFDFLTFPLEVVRKYPFYSKFANRHVKKVSVILNPHSVYLFLDLSISMKTPHFTYPTPRPSLGSMKY